MLKVTITLHPFGEDASARVIHELYIANVKQYGNIADYHLWKETDPREERPRPKPDAVLTGFDRSRGAVELLGELLKKGTES